MIYIVGMDINYLSALYVDLIKFILLPLRYLNGTKSIGDGQINIYIMTVRSLVFINLKQYKK
nr:MAG TPA: hypothetical protein [Caudoviricetes sp.]